MNRHSPNLWLTLICGAAASLSAPGVEMTVTYDADGRVVSARYGDRATIDYLYDADGNLVGRTATVQNQQPVIDAFTADPATGDAPLETTLSCQAHDPEGGALTYAWDLDGDGTVDQTSDTGTLAHTYSDPGTYHPTCAVTDNQGATTISEPLTIDIQAAPAWQDITEALQISHSPRQLYDRRHRCFYVLVTVENPGDALQGPIRLVITDPNIPVKTGVGAGLDPDGYTDDGDPYFTLVHEDETLDTGGALDPVRINFELQRKRLTYGTRVEQYR